jgi:hypothetical protein
MRLGDYAAVVRSKNAGPFVVTFDILFEDVAALERVRATGDLTVETVARAFEVSPNQIRDFAYYPFACAVKFSMMRPTASGSRFDTDVYGAQQYAPLADLPLALEAPKSSAP